MSEDPDSSGLDVEVVLQDHGWLPLCEDVETTTRKIAAVVGDYVEEFKCLPRLAEVAVVLGGDDFIRDLNRQYRGVDAATNVLAFEQRSTDPGWPAASTAEGCGSPMPLGDVVLARETVEREASAQGKRFSDHFSHLLVHGLLHLVGYDHQVAAEAQRMESVERAVLARVGIADPYRDQVDDRE